jgi:hypothetical protein
MEERKDPAGARAQSGRGSSAQPRAAVKDSPCVKDSARDTPPFSKINMTIDWLKLIAALALLLTPVAWFHGRGVHHRDLSRDWDGYWRATLTLWTHAFDLVRAILGAWLLVEALNRAPGAQGLLKYGHWAGRGIVLCAATILQTVICRERDAMNAPFAFVIGLVVSLMPPLVAALGLVLGGMVAFGTHMRTLFFPVLAVSSAGLGALFLGKKLPLDLAGIGAAALLPWLLPVLFHRHAVCAYRARKRGKDLDPLK